MFRRALIILTVIAVLGTPALIYFGGLIDDGSFVDTDKCSGGSDYYRQNEVECDTVVLVIPCVVVPVWLVLAVLWFFEWLGRNVRKERIS